MDDNAYRIEELEEKRTEFIINESGFADDHPSWGEVYEAQVIAEKMWDETEDGKEYWLLLEGNMGHYIIEFYYNTDLRTDLDVWASSEVTALIKALDMLQLDNNINNNSWCTDKGFSVKITRADFRN